MYIADVCPGLFGGQEIVDNGMNHRQQTVVYAGVPIPRMQPVIDATVGMKVSETGQRLVNDEQTLKVRTHLRRTRLELRRERGTPQTTHGPGQGGQRLIVQRHGPRTAQPLAHGRVRRLQRIVPVAVAIGCQMGTRNDPCGHDAERPFDMRPQCGRLGVVVALRVEERHHLVEQRRIFRGQKVLRQGQNRPQDNVTVRFARADVPLAVEKHEPLRPIAIRILRRVQAHEKIP